MLHVADMDIDPADIGERAAGGLDRGPAASIAVLTFSHTCRVCASMSPMPAMPPSALRATMPEMNTSRPRASTTIPCEKWPLGWASAGETIGWRGIADLGFGWQARRSYPASDRVSITVVPSPGR
jgi:hypothetical protein